MDNRLTDYRTSADTDINGFTARANRFLRLVATQTGNAPTNLVSTKNYAVPMVDRDDPAYDADHGRQQVSVPGNVDLTTDPSINITDLPSHVSIMGNLRAPLAFFSDLPLGKTLSVNGKVIVATETPMNNGEQDTLISRLERMNGLDAKDIAIESKKVPPRGIRERLSSLWK